MRVAGGLGTIPRVVGDGQEIYRERLNVEEALSRIEALYKPYHRALRRLINKAHQAFGTVIVVQLELNRAVYMDERRRERGPRFAQVVADFARLADALAEVPLGELGPFQAAAE